MKEDLTKKSGILYLSLFLLAVCAVATAIMAPVALLTEKPIQQAKMAKTAEGLRIVMPDFDNDPFAEKKEYRSRNGSTVTIYPLRQAGHLAGFAVSASTESGYGGHMEGLIGFNKDLSIRKYIITDHRETPGIGTKVTDRVRKRKLTDILTGKAADSSLPPNATLDSYEGLKVGTSDAQSSEKYRAENVDMVSSAISNPDAPHLKKWSGKDVHFVTGATISSMASADLAWRAAVMLSKHSKEFPENLESGKDM